MWIWFEVTTHRIAIFTFSTCRPNSDEQFICFSCGTVREFWTLHVYTIIIIIDHSSCRPILNRQNCNESTHAINKHINLLLLHHNLWTCVRSILFNRSMPFFLLLLFSLRCIYCFASWTITFDVLRHLTCPDGIRNWRVQERAKSVGSIILL